MKKSEKMLLEDRIMKIYSEIVKNTKVVDGRVKESTPIDVHDAVNRMNEAIRACEVEN